MMSKPASVTSHAQESIRDEPTEAAKIPLKGKGLDIASQMQSVKQAEPDLAGAVGDYSTSVAQTLGVIEAIEATLQQKRRQIEEIQARQKVLAREYRQLGESLDTATKDLAEEFFEIIADLEANRPIAVPPTETAFEVCETHIEPLAETAPEVEEILTDPSAVKASVTSDIFDEPPRDTSPETISDANGARTVPQAEFASETAPETASEAAPEMASEMAPETDEALDLDQALSDLPPVPEFLGERQDTSDQNGDGVSRDAGASSRPWWKHGKKG
jgi:hypothetical protein